MKNIQFLIVSILVATAFSTTGCTSFRSLIMHRQEDDSLSRQCCPRKTCGVPVKLKVPSHVEVAIVETYFIIPPRGNEDNKKPPKIQTLTPNGRNRILSVEKSLEYTDKVFTVDFPRPFAGTLSLGDQDSDKAGLEFDAEQYFKSIRGKVEDETIDTITKVLGSDAFAATTGETTRALNVKVENGNYQRLKRVVAFQRFDISEQGWEDQMQAFIDQHLGQCNPPCGTCDLGAIINSVTPPQPAVHVDGNFGRTGAIINSVSAPKYEMSHSKSPGIK